eukprot:COSAG06_NODE_67522_length_251_cov_1.671053_1_plen_49_part_01
MVWQLKWGEIREALTIISIHSIPWRWASAWIAPITLVLYLGNHIEPATD